MLGSRARYDASRQLGNANAIAAGVDLTRVVVLSDRELAAMQQLAQRSDDVGNDDDDNRRLLDAARTAEEQRRRRVREERTAHWPDTTNARHDTFLRNRDAKQREAEQRRVAMDVLHAQKRDAERRTAVAGAALARLRDDARVRHAASTLLLHTVMREREAQVAARAHAAAEARAQEQQARVQAQMDDWAASTAAMQHRLAARAARVSVAQANMQMLQHQIEQRRRDGADGRAQRTHAEQEARAEAHECAVERCAQRARAAACAAYNAAATTLPTPPDDNIHDGNVHECHGGNSGKSAPSRVAALRARMAHDAATAAALQQQTDSLAALHAAHDAASQQRRANAQRRQAATAEHVMALYAQPSVIARTQDRFAAASKNNDDNDDDNNKGMCGANGAPDTRPHGRVCDTRDKAVTATSADGHDDHAPRKAAITGHGGGFVSADDARAHTRETQQRAEQWREEQASATRTRRTAAEALAREQACQAAHKRVCAAQEAADERAHTQAAREQAAAEAAACTSYIAAQLPDDLSPTLRRKAMQVASL